ncbi:hypothetical protein L207DRAFT_532411 [Hyaloscypha variabilis F]|uniref:NWD NACHT-NTPase N-terminal domain-containing protein n=1 Tax=Hyaloscypha variabilis (strain UAMH 11265 / GT02V1 / F) TaxID=1149755 RepID=A0A2J6RE82_HYAVF|nr:hypothetical protein L207DRAFT_532411 [Hyaloscypha variabilis F]
MSTKLSLRERLKSHRSKRAGNPEEQNSRHPPDGPTTPPTQVPPSIVPFTDAQPGHTGVGPQAKEPLQATEFVVQQTQAISTSQRLWNEAYESLENDNETSELVRAYVKTLTTVLTAEKAPDTSKLRDPIERQIYRKKLVKDGQAKVSTAPRIINTVGNVAQFIPSAKGIIDLAIQNIQQAALPRVAICIGLQILLNPPKATKSNLTGINYVVSRMYWYCALTEHLLHKDNIKIRSLSDQFCISWRWQSRCSTMLF